MDEKKQIEDMAHDMCGNFMSNGNCATDDEPCNLECVYGCRAEKLYCKGYRKQSVGEWKTNIPATIRVFETNSITCSLCGHGGSGSIDKPYPNFCPNCGARMKGGAQE